MRRRLPSWYWPLCLVAGVLWPGGSAAQTTAPVAIVGATLWDGTGVPALPDATVVVSNGIIRCAGTSARCPVPVGATRVDARGAWLLPGLIDTHVHLLLRQGGVTSRATGTDLHDLLARGITAVRDMGNNPAPLLEAARAAGPAPRVFAMQLVAGINFFRPENERGPGGTVVQHTPASLGMFQLGWYPIMFTLRGNPEQVVREARDGGAIGLKLYQDLDAEQVAALVRAAHAAGMPVWGHAWVQPASVREQAEAGQDGVVHAAGLVGELLSHRSRESLRAGTALLRITADSASAESARRPEVLAALDTLAARGTWLEPTLRAAELGADRAGHRHGTASTLPERYALAASPFGFEVVRQAVAKGVRITAGTDHVAFGPASEQAQLTDELALLVDSIGLTPARALLAATRDAALAIGPAAKGLGVIQAGSPADLVLLEADPLADIRNLERVRWVMRDGRRYTPAEARALP